MPHGLWDLSSLTWRRQWHPTPVLLPGRSHGRRSLVGCSPWGREESDTIERLHFHFSLSCIGEGNGNPLQCSCLENPRDGGAWWAAIYGVAQSRTLLKRLSSSSSLTRDQTQAHSRESTESLTTALPENSQIFLFLQKNIIEILIVLLWICISLWVVLTTMLNLQSMNTECLCICLCLLAKFCSFLYANFLLQSKYFKFWYSPVYPFFL